MVKQLVSATVSGSTAIKPGVFLNGFRLRYNAKAAQSRWIEVKLAKLFSRPITASQRRPSAGL